MINPYNKNSLIEILSEHLSVNSVLFVIESNNIVINDYFKSFLKDNINSLNINKYIVFNENLIEIDSCLIEIDIESLGQIINNNKILNLTELKNKIIVFTPPNIDLSFTKNEKIQKLFIASNFKIPTPGKDELFQFLIENLKIQKIKLDDQAIQYLKSEIFENAVTLDHVLNYLQLLKNNRLDINLNNVKNLTLFGSLIESINNHGEHYLSFFYEHFPLIDFENFVRLFFKKKSDETLQINPINENEAVEIFESKKELESFIDKNNKSDFRFFYIREINNKIHLLINESYIKYWEYIQNIITKERIDANIYLLVSNLAEDYNDQKGQLLSKSQLIEALKLKESKCFNLKWSLKYNNKFELVKKFIDFSIDYNNNLEQSQERKRKLQLKRAKTTVLFVGGAFIISLILALFAFSSLQKAEEATLEAKQSALRADENAKRATEEKLKAKNAKKIAEDFAEVSKQNELKALNARNQASRNAEKARKSQIDAIKARERAQESMNEAIRNKEVADLQRKMSDQKTKQEQARSTAMTALQNYANNDNIVGFKKSILAYNTNKDNNGDLFQSDILFSLIKGFANLNPIEIDFETSIKNIKTSNDYLNIAFLSIENKLHIASYEKLFLGELITTLYDVKDFEFLKNDVIIILKTNGNIEKLSLKNKNLIPVDGFGKDQTFNLFIQGHATMIASNEFLYHIDDPKNTIELNDNISNRIIKNLKFNNDKKTYYSFEEENFYALTLENQKISKKLLKRFDSFVSCFSNNFDSNLIAIGLYDGTLIIFDLDNDNIIFNNKIHQSQISNIHIGEFNGKTMIVSNSYDSKIKLFFGNIDNWSSNSYSSVDNISTHNTWITDSFLLPNNTLVSFDTNGKIKKWELNIDKIINSPIRYEKSK